MVKTPLEIPLIWIYKSNKEIYCILRHTAVYFLFSSKCHLFLSFLFKKYISHKTMHQDINTVHLKFKDCLFELPVFLN